MFEIVTDSGSNISAQEALKMGIFVLPMQVEADSTSLVNPELCRKTLERLSGQADVLYICLSGAISGTYRTTRMVAGMVRTPHRIFAVDSKSASMGEGLLVRYAVKLRDKGETAEKAAELLERERDKICHLFLVGNTENARRSGRFLPDTTNAVILTMDESGKIFPCHRSRDRKTALRYIAKMYRRTVLPTNPELCIAHAENPEEAAFLAGEIGGNVQIEPLDPLFVHHTGVGTVSIFYRGTLRKNPLL